MSDVTWIDCDKWEDLPVGSWLVRIDKETMPYAVADVAENNSGHKIIDVGGHFHWDMRKLIAYSNYVKYDDKNERIKKLEVAFKRLIDLAGECDGWESFPSNALDEAYAVIENK